MLRWRLELKVHGGVSVDVAGRSTSQYGGCGCRPAWLVMEIRS